MAGSSSKYKCSARSLLNYYVSAPKRDFPDEPLYAMRPNHLGWILFIIMPDASLPALLTHGFGILVALLQMAGGERHQIAPGQGMGSILNGRNGFRRFLFEWIGAGAILQVWKHIALSLTVAPTELRPFRRTERIEF